MYKEVEVINCEECKNTFGDNKTCALKLWINSMQAEWKGLPSSEVEARTMQGITFKTRDCADEEMEHVTLRARTHI